MKIVTNRGAYRVGIQRCLVPSCKGVVMTNSQIKAVAVNIKAALANKTSLFAYAAATIGIITSSPASAGANRIGVNCSGTTDVV